MKTIKKEVNKLVEDQVKKEIIEITIDEQLEEIRNDLRKCVGYDKKINTLVAAVEKLTDIVAAQGVKTGNDDSEMGIDNDG